MSLESIVLGDLVDSGEIYIQTGPFGTQLRASDYTTEGTPVINVRNIGYGDLRTEQLEYVPIAVVDRLKKHVIEKNDIVFGRKGAVDRHLLVTDSQSGWMQGSDCIRIRIKSPRLMPEYLSRALCLDTHKRWMITQCSNKATMASLNQDVICRIPIILQEPSVQRKVVSILSAYDDLIENNRRRIQLLEQAARLLYKEWFVNLRFPGHEHTKIVDGVPEGWKKKRIDERFKTVLGGTPSRKNPEFWGGDVPWINSGEVNKNRILKPTEMLTQKGLLRSASKLMPAGSTVIAITGATLGQVSRLEIECSANQSVVGIFDTEDWMNEWLYLFFSHEIRKIANHATGGAQQHINKEIINATEFVEPPPTVVEMFGQFIKPIFAQTKGLELQNISLAKARDLLLPKLMNGEVAV